MDYLIYFRRRFVNNKIMLTFDEYDTRVLQERATPIIPTIAAFYIFFEVCSSPYGRIQ